MLGVARSTLSFSPPFHMGHSDVFPGFRWTVFPWLLQLQHTVHRDPGEDT